jgi:hypothetical protein
VPDLLAGLGQFSKLCRRSDNLLRILHFYHWDALQANQPILTMTFYYGQIDYRNRLSTAIAHHFGPFHYWTISPLAFGIYGSTNAARCPFLSLAGNKPVDGVRQDLHRPFSNSRSPPHTMHFRKWISVAQPQCTPLLISMYPPSMMT